MNILDFLRDAQWQFWGALVGLLGLVVTIVVYLKGRDRKELSCVVGTFTRLLGIQEGLEGRVMITFDGKPVESLFVLQATLRNSGRLPITPEDYREPIAVQFDEDAQILSAYITNCNPSYLDVSVSIEEKRNRVTFSRVLLNRRESFSFQLLVDNPGPFRGFQHRIVDVTNIPLRSATAFFPGVRRSDWMSAMFGFVLFLFVIVLVPSASVVWSLPVSSNLQFAIAGGVLGVMIASLVLILRLAIKLLKAVYLSP